MRTALSLLTMVMLCIPMISVSAEDLAPQVEGAGPLIVIGGYNVSESHVSSILLQSPNNSILAEDYTATWCENCVTAEHALDEIAESYNVTQFHFHPEIDGQDPFGTAEGDDWWERRYGERLAPTIIFHGSSIHLGSVAKIKNTLVEDYSISTAAQYSYGEGELEYSWTPRNDGGTIHWNLTSTPDGGGLFPEHSGYGHQFHAFIIEESAYFPDGTNGMENYTNIVSQISFLGDTDSGQTTITLPTAYDGNDLQIHLVMELIPPTDDGGSLVDGKGDSQVILYSSIGIGGAVILLLGIILFLRKGSPGPESEMMNAPVQEPTLTDPPAGADERSAQQLAYEKELVDPD
ncbi:MAG: hypothetical protein NZ770_06170 [Candidatus Poseidoniaceae archaeon]|nr:hypothetical protein [Candidatus Poseidoniaceae archaeon]